MANQKYDSKGTSLRQVPATFKDKNFISNLKSGSTNFDYGGGAYDLGSEYLKNNFGVDNYVYDPFNRTPEHNDFVLKHIKQNMPDTMTMNNVLNVIKEPEIRRNVIKDSYNYVKPGGNAYYKIHEGSLSGSILERSNPENFSLFGRETKTKGGLSWQNNMKTQAYIKEISEALGIPENQIKRKGNIIIVPKILQETRVLKEAPLPTKSLEQAYQNIVKNRKPKVVVKANFTPKSAVKVKPPTKMPTSLVDVALSLYDFFANPMVADAPTIPKPKPKPKPDVFTAPESIRNNNMYERFINARNKQT